MTKFKNKYRIESNRFQGWDYGSNGLYFITICTKFRECYFGNVKNGKMKLSPIGHIANSCWIEISNHFPFVVLHHHIVMPNHVHGIIEIAKNDAFIANDASLVETPKLGVSTTTATADTTSNALSAINCTQNASKKWNPNTLGSIINQYKRIGTINARKIYPDFAWQPNYHDHVIRNEKSYQNITNYIVENPMKWNDDRFNPKHPNPNK